MRKAVGMLAGLCIGWLPAFGSGTGTMSPNAGHADRALFVSTQTPVNLPAIDKIVAASVLALGKGTLPRHPIDGPARPA